MSCLHPAQTFSVFQTSPHAPPDAWAQCKEILSTPPENRTRTDIDALRNLAASNPYFNQFQAQPVLIDTLLRVSCASPKLKGQTVTSDARFAFAVVIEGELKSYPVKSSDNPTNFPILGIGGGIYSNTSEIHWRVTRASLLWSIDTNVADDIISNQYYVSFEEKIQLLSSHPELNALFNSHGGDRLCRRLALSARCITREPGSIITLPGEGLPAGCWMITAGRIAMCRNAQEYNSIEATLAAISSSARQEEADANAIASSNTNLGGTIKSVSSSSVPGDDLMRNPLALDPPLSFVWLAPSSFLPSSVPEVLVPVLSSPLVVNEIDKSNLQVFFTPRTVPADMFYCAPVHAVTLLLLPTSCFALIPGGVWRAIAGKADHMIQQLYSIKCAKPGSMPLNASCVSQNSPKSLRKSGGEQQAKISPSSDVLFVAHHNIQAQTSVSARPRPPPQSYSLSNSSNETRRHYSSQVKAAIPVSTDVGSEPAVPLLNVSSTPPVPSIKLSKDPNELKQQGLPDAVVFGQPRIDEFSALLKDRAKLSLCSISSGSFDKRSSCDIDGEIRSKNSNDDFSSEDKIDDTAQDGTIAETKVFVATEYAAHRHAASYKKRRRAARTYAAVVDEARSAVAIGLPPPYFGKNALNRDLNVDGWGDNPSNGRADETGTHLPNTTSTSTGLKSNVTPSAVSALLCSGGLLSTRGAVYKKPLVVADSNVTDHHLKASRSVHDRLKSPAHNANKLRVVVQNILSPTALQKEQEIIKYKISLENSGRAPSRERGLLSRLARMGIEPIPKQDNDDYVSRPMSQRPLGTLSRSEASQNAAMALASKSTRNTPLYNYASYYFSDDAAEVHGVRGAGTNRGGVLTDPPMLHRPGPSYSRTFGAPNFGMRNFSGPTEQTVSDFVSALLSPRAIPGVHAHFPSFERPGRKLVHNFVALADKDGKLQVADRPPSPNSKRGINKNEPAGETAQLLCNGAKVAIKKNHGRYVAANPPVSDVGVLALDPLLCNTSGCHRTPISCNHEFPAVALPSAEAVFALWDANILSSRPIVSAKIGSRK